jgi:transposase
MVMGQTFIGMDIAKDRLDVHVPPSDEAFTVTHDSDGLAKLVERLRPLDAYLVVMEATQTSPRYQRLVSFGKLKKLALTRGHAHAPHHPQRHGPR